MRCEEGWVGLREKGWGMEERGGGDELRKDDVVRFVTYLDEAWRLSVDMWRTNEVVMKGAGRGQENERVRF